MTPWTSVLEYDDEKRILAGSKEALTNAVRRAADLSINTEFRHSEHIDSTSDNPELIQEVAQRGVTYLLEDRWSAGIITQRQPIEPPEGFGPRASLSFFMYNQNGEQAFARPHLDGPPRLRGRSGGAGPSIARDHRRLRRRCAVVRRYKEWVDAGRGRRNRRRRS